MWLDARPRTDTLFLMACCLNLEGLLSQAERPSIPVQAWPHMRNTPKPPVETSPGARLQMRLLVMRKQQAGTVGLTDNKYGGSNQVTATEHVHACVGWFIKDLP